MVTATSTDWAKTDDWQDAWQPLIDAVGTDFGAELKQEAIETIERGAIRRLCEPIEMDCPIFYDEEVARQHGYHGIPAPISGISQTWIDPGLWKPGQETPWPTQERDAMPPRRASAGAMADPSPPTVAGFATDVETEYHQDAYVGDRLTLSGNRLISVLPKETSVGRGAFMIRESYVHNQRGELIATLRRGSYSYVPFAR